MVGPVRSAHVGAIGQVRATGNGGQASRTGRALSRIAGRIADRLAREFDLLSDREGSGGQNLAGHEDLYAIGDAARELSGELGGKPSDEGRLAYSLKTFAQESAVLVAARPSSVSLDVIARAIARQHQADTTETVASALLQIDQTTRDVIESRSS